MFRKSAILALAAAATFGLSAFAPTAASAHGWKHHHHHHGHWHGHYRRAIYIAPRPVVYRAAPVVVRSAPRPVCLTKEYTPQGQVLFRDVCTGEMALNPPTQIPQQQQQTGMQMPQDAPQVR